MKCLTDDFDRADDASSLGVATSGDTWTLQPAAPYDALINPITPPTSVLGINSNRAYSSDTTAINPGRVGHLEIATVDLGGSDIDATVDLILPFDQGGGGGLTFRWSDSTHFWIALLYHALSPTDYLLYLRKQTGGGASRSDPVSEVFALADGTTGSHSLRVVAVGDSIELYVDGTLKATVSDSFNDDAENHGIQTYFSTTVRLDNVSICAEPVGWFLDAMYW